jgi:valyl-tRNA synthetase
VQDEMRSSIELPKVYDPRQIEEKWSQEWANSHYFHAEVEKGKEAFCIVIPPPNVTGFLHLGHALDNALQDILIRWKRMSGYSTTWIPGTDHAGIATQVKVESRLAEEGLTRYDLGYEGFLERVWAWKDEYEERITNQLKRIGASCDWARQRFTMDEEYSKAVREVFVTLYENGLIYQGDYIINWCPRCKTALSDIEVEHEDTEGRLYYIKYSLKGEEGHVVVATTRPETMLGDTAVAVHPKDARYKALVGKELILPIMERTIPIIADDFVQPEFGTGAVKVTPAHDPNDFAMGERHDLSRIRVIGEDGRMTKEAGKYEGYDRYECRKALVEELEATGFLLKIQEHQHAVGHCQRCDNVIEPLLSRQWFVKMRPLAEPALKVVKEGKIEFVPERFSKVYINWLENVHDWCISRQLWWGHRIPVWYCQDCKSTIVSKTDPTECTECGSKDLKQDPDVLDTWFSSSLWPFATLGWPEKTPELETFYPTSVLVTGYDIIFFWVARMVFMGMEFMEEIPFKYVFIHGLIRDSQGRKMSKSLGNSVDPLDMVEEYGADALRFTLITGNAPGNDMRFQREKIEGNRNFANKIWNASRFVFMNLEDSQPVNDEKELVSLNLSLVDKWILSRYNNAVQEVTRLLGEFEIGEAARVLYDFIWSEFCDWYIEMSKPLLQDEDARGVTQNVLSYVLAGTLKLLHPFMPFITEEIWQYLPGTEGTITLATWPKYTEVFHDTGSEEKVTIIMEVIKSIRNLRAEMNISPGKRIRVLLHTDETRGSLLEAEGIYIKRLAGVEDLVIYRGERERPQKAVAAIAAGVEVYLPLEGLVDIDKEISRLKSELSATEREIKRLEGKLSNQGFLQKAPSEIVEGERRKLSANIDKREKLAERLASLER